jgi:hypothetical protein
MAAPSLTMSFLDGLSELVEGAPPRDGLTRTLLFAAWLMQIRADERSDVRALQERAALAYLRYDHVRLIAQRDARLARSAWPPLGKRAVKRAAREAAEAERAAAEALVLRLGGVAHDLRRAASREDDR